MQTSKEKIKECAYCGANGIVTKDHVPPKSLFPKPRPSNLITVPACSNCHSQRTSLDDEYFRVALNVREELSEHPDVRKAQPAVVRSLFRPNKVGMLEAFLKNVRLVEQMTPGGLFIKHTFALQTDTDRLRRVVQRILKGLFFHERGYRLPDSYEALVASDENVEKWPANFQEGLIAPLQTRPAITLGNAVFSYRFAFNLDQNASHASAWIFVFYQHAWFLGMTLPRAESVAARGE